MTDEEKARGLLLRAARLPDEISPPVQGLIRLGRQRRRQRSAQRALAIGVVALVAVVTPQVIHAIRPPGARPQSPGHLPSPGLVFAAGPTGAQIARYLWSSLPSSPLGPRDQPLLVAAGRYLIELGGVRDGNSVNDGAALNLTTRRWHKIAAVDGNVGFDQAVAVWTGSEVFVTNGQEASCLGGRPVAPCLPHAGLYDPVTNRWTATLLPRVMAGLDPVSVTWTGRVIVLAGLDAHNGRLAVAAYDPVSGRWQVITPRLPAGHPPSWVYLAEARGRVILWSGWLGSNPQVGKTGIDVFALNSAAPNPLGAWHDLTGAWPGARSFSAAIFTGHSLLITPGGLWCGVCSGDQHLLRAYFVSPRTLRRTATIPLDTVGSPGPDFIWAGRTVIGIHFARGNPVPYSLHHLGDYDPATGRWRALPAGPGRVQPDVLPVWTGSELVVVTEQGTTLALHR